MDYSKQFYRLSLLLDCEENYPHFSSTAASTSFFTGLLR